MTTSTTRNRSILFIGFLLSLIICGTGENHLAFAKRVLLPPDNEYSTIRLKTADTSSASAQTIIHSLDSFYKIQTRHGFNGSVLVGYEGKILYERYFGYANRRTGEKLGPNTPGQLASTSKPFLATAILWLYQNHYLDINKPVQTYLKKFPYPTITVKMLMDHRSGLPPYLHFADKYWIHRKLKSNDDLLHLFEKVKPRLVFTPGSRFKYCNSNYAILAEVLQKVTDMSYPKFMKEFIFKPLGMDQTFVYDPLHDSTSHPNMTVSYHYNWHPWAIMFADGIYGDKNIYSTVEDMYRWDQSFYHHVLLNKKTLKMAYTGYSPDMRGFRNYGLGWRMKVYPDGYKVIYHNGWWHGNNNVFYRFIRDNFTIIVLGNRFKESIYNQAEAIYNIVQKDAVNKPKMDWGDNDQSTE